MKKLFLILSIIFMATLLLGEDFITANNLFSVELYKVLSKEHDNLFFSPFSISTAFAMAYLGASGNTAMEMERVLHFKDNVHEEISKLLKDFRTSEKPYQLFIANTMWAQEGYPFLKEYLEKVQKFYESGLNFVDFISKTRRKEALKKINEWVKEKTLGKITELLKEDDINSLTRLVLTNAIYFKASWAKPFEPESTEKGIFHISEKESVEVDMMRQEGIFNYFEDERVQMLELPYEGNEISMLILLPKKGLNLKDFEETLDFDVFKRWLNSLNAVSVDVRLPKFKIESRLSLKKTLMNMGMESAFTESADFSKMDGTRKLKIQNVIHKAFVSVDEKGTEAAAATAVIIGLKALRVPVLFEANRPFMFFIYDRKNDLILFVGKLVEPS
ncbi:MAG: serpin [Thermotogaceae bacterium]|nr:serpin [Thermotogaceae bacterium]